MDSDTLITHVTHCPTEQSVTPAPGPRTTSEVKSSYVSRAGPGDHDGVLLIFPPHKGLFLRSFLHGRICDISRRQNPKYVRCDETIRALAKEGSIGFRVLRRNNSMYRKWSCWRYTFLRKRRQRPRTQAHGDADVDDKMEKCCFGDPPS